MKTTTDQTLRESFLHFIWQFQKFNPASLSTVDGLPITVCATGNLNTNAGPDFHQAKIVVGEITWFGHVEIHIRSSDWNRHRHQEDDAYNNVILHVVWEHDQEVMTKSGLMLPVLELKNRVSDDLLRRCNQLVKSPEDIPCSMQIHQTRSIDRMSMLDHAGTLRLKKKAEFILQHLNKNKGNWEETTFQVLARNFGFKTNDEAFLKLAGLIGHKVMTKNAGGSLATEALIFGMAGFLTDGVDSYQQDLVREFEYIAKKYKLTGSSMIRAEWKYLRLRPGNFPTVRLAQFAGFVQKNARSFDRFIHFADSQELRSFFDFQPSNYWQKHYDFSKKSKKINLGIGKSSVDLILINTVVPLLAAYARYTDCYAYMEKAVGLLQEIKPEKNHIIRKWETLQLKVNNAFESQSLIELRNEFCLKKKCLSCKIGVSLINN